MKFQFETIDHVQLAAPARGEKQARAFYGGILGLEEIVKPKSLQSRGGLWFKSGNVHIHIGIDEYFTPAKKAHPAIQVKSLSTLKQHLINEHIHVIVDHRLPGAERFYVEDSFGNCLEFLEWHI